MRSRLSGKTLATTLGIASVLILVIFSAGCTQPPTSTAQQTTAPVTTTQGMTGIANPASVNCVNSGGSLKIMNDATGGQYGMCQFPNGTTCEEWALFRGEGCKQGPTVAGTTTPGAKMMVTFTQTDDGTTKEMGVGSQFAVQLESNPTTGYQWNATVSQGLVITNNSYKENPHPSGMVGVGGNQMWIVKANAAGKQTFSAIYKRPWEPTTGNETPFVLNLNVV